MKLIYRLVIYLSIALSVILALWAAFFYIAIIEEINDETDDFLEDYSEQIIVRFLAGEELPTKSIHSNNQYYLFEVTPEYALNNPNISYKDSMIYIPQKRETEPARILTTIYKDEEGKYYELVVSVPTIEKKDLQEAILFWVIFLYVGLLIIIIFINVLIFQHVNRPLHKLLDWLDEYRVGGKNSPLQNETDIIEFKKLNESAVRNMKRAEEVFEEQKLFIGNASHEIQTPLAVCRNRLENLMEDETLTEAQLGELAKTYHTLVYITKLNKTLLLLSRIENKQFEEKEEIELNVVVNKLIQDYKEVYYYMNIDVDVHETEICKVCMNETLADILINNLIKNGYIHNIENGKLSVEISSSKVIFRNTGPESPLNSRLIFERFYKGSKKEDSSGLGLTLVKSICQIEHLHLAYYFRDGLHCFEVSV